jgi:hypothetical protein
MEETETMEIFSAEVQRRVRRGTETQVTQVAAGAFGVFVGMVFWQVFQANPPALLSLASAIGAVTGGVMTGIIDALTPADGKKVHTAYYIIGLLAGVLLMIALIYLEIVPQLTMQPTPSPSPSPAG